MLNWTSVLNFIQSIFKFKSIFISWVTKFLYIISQLIFNPFKKYNYSDYWTCYYNDCIFCILTNFNSILSLIKFKVHHLVLQMVLYVYVIFQKVYLSPNNILIGASLPCASFDIFLNSCIINILYSMLIWFLLSYSISKYLAWYGKYIIVKLIVTILSLMFLSLYQNYLLQILISIFVLHMSSMLCFLWNKTLT